MGVIGVRHFAFRAEAQSPWASSGSGTKLFEQLRWCGYALLDVRAGESCRGRWLAEAILRVPFIKS